jgi:hypothetical protein
LTPGAGLVPTAFDTADPAPTEPSPSPQRCASPIVPTVFYAAEMQHIACVSGCNPLLRGPLGRCCRSCERRRTPRTVGQPLAANLGPPATRSTSGLEQVSHHARSRLRHLGSVPPASCPARLPAPLPWGAAHPVRRPYLLLPLRSDKLSLAGQPATPCGLEKTPLGEGRCRACMVGPVPPPSDQCTTTLR